eukprot:scaffold164314_cov37-Prasinocladus_malaysianus.AAC.1
MTCLRLRNLVNNVVAINTANLALSKILAVGLGMTRVPTLMTPASRLALQELNIDVDQTTINTVFGRGAFAENQVLIDTANAFVSLWGKNDIGVTSLADNSVDGDLPPEVGNYLRLLTSNAALLAQTTIEVAAEARNSVVGDSGFSTHDFIVQNVLNVLTANLGLYIGSSLNVAVYAWNAFVESEGKDNKELQNLVTVLTANRAVLLNTEINLEVYAANLEVLGLANDDVENIISLTTAVGSVIRDSIINVGLLSRNENIFGTDFDDLTNTVEMNIATVANLKNVIVNSQWGVKNIAAGYGGGAELENVLELNVFNGAGMGWWRQGKQVKDSTATIAGAAYNQVFGDNDAYNEVAVDIGVLTDFEKFLFGLPASTIRDLNVDLALATFNSVRRGDDNLLWNVLDIAAFNGVDISGVQANMVALLQNSVCLLLFLLIYHFVPCQDNIKR